tara:strand:+ start:487 stop:699 length:213 start_codon:yes stop_codon:yes gene_type:complete
MIIELTNDNIVSVKELKSRTGIIMALQVTTTEKDHRDNIIFFSVPQSEDNRHYRQIQEWVAEGNTIEEAD